MKFFFVDDSNISKDDKLEFFLYGGIVVDEKDMLRLSKELTTLKTAAGIKTERPVKWNNENWNGEVIDSAIFKKLKEDILALVGASNLKIIVYLVPHDFYHTYKVAGIFIKSVIDPERQKTAQRYALNVSLYKFDQYLVQEESLGFVLADEFGSNLAESMVKHCFAMFPNGTDYTLNRIVFPVMQVSNEYSAMHQVNDIVLGAMQMSLKEIGFNFLPIIRGNIWGMEGGSPTDTLSKGFNIYPKRQISDSIRESISKLREKYLRLMAT
jgi:hypothetical protein